LVLIDESGLLMAPLVRRTLAPKGQTPLLLHNVTHQGRRRDKVSLIAALTLSPKIQRLGLYFSTLVNDYFDHVTVAWFLRQLLRHLRGPMIVVWDRGPMHRGPEVRRLVATNPRLILEELPAYAPDLNPVEPIWSHLKWNRLCNFAPATSTELERTVFKELRCLRNNQKQLRGMWDGSDLPWPRVLAS
jgi:transposase